VSEIAGLPFLESDGAKLKQVLQNLINNAIKFTGQGSVTISARHEMDSDTLAFEVKDTGIGIGREMVPVIFEKFRQVDSSDNRQHEGMGLGLYIVKQFVDLLGGTIGVESELGRGSVFRVVLPCASPAASPTRIAVEPQASL
jgi:signal transduction histidine kinase